MKRVFATADGVLAGWLESALVAEGIACVMRNQYLAGAIGDLPLNECWPQIWVVEDADYARAERIINNILAPRPDGARAWSCALCGEHLEAQFDECWQCGSSRMQAHDVGA